MSYSLRSVPYFILAAGCLVVILTQIFMTQPADVMKEVKSLKEHVIHLEEKVEYISRRVEEKEPVDMVREEPRLTP